MATTISNISIQTLGQEAVEVFAGSTEELGIFATDMNTAMGMGDTLRIPVATAGTASHLANFAGDGSASVTTVPVTLAYRYGDILTLTDEQLANLGPAIKNVVKQEVKAAIIATLKNAHSVVTSANFTLSTGIAAKAASAFTIDDFAANVAAVVGLNKLNPDNLFFVATPVVFTNILAGLKNVYAFDKTLSDALVSAGGFKYAGVKIIRSSNLPSAIKGGYFTDGTAVAVAFGVDKMDGSVANAPEIETFIDDKSGLGYNIRTWYDPNSGGRKVVPYIVTNAAAANPFGAVIANLT